MATLALLEKLERFVGNNNPPAAGDTVARKLLIDVAVALRTRSGATSPSRRNTCSIILRNPAIPKWRSILRSNTSKSEMSAVRIIALARAAAASGFSPAAWSEFRLLARQLAEQLTAHVHKEEGVLVPLLQDSMEGDTEEQLYTAYVMNEEAF